MTKKLSIFTFIIFFLSCGDQVTIIEENPIPDPEESYEVNLIGYATGEDRAYISDVNVTVDGLSSSSTSTGLFHSEKKIIGKRGLVITAEKAGYLPTHKRIYHHRKLETVVANVSMVEIPEPIFIPHEGKQIEELNIQIDIEDQDIDSEAQLIFHVASSANESIDIDPYLIDDKIEYLNTDAFFYLDLNASTASNQTIEISTSINTGTNELSLYKYNKTNASWEVVNAFLANVDDRIVGNYAGDGWYTFASLLPTVYSSITLQEDNELPLETSETSLSTEGSSSKEILYTSSTGQINKYFPIQKEQTLDLDGGAINLEVDQFLNSGTAKSIETGNIILTNLEGQAYDCALEIYSGYISMISDNQHIIKPIQNGEFDISILRDDHTITAEFYDSEFELIHTQELQTAEYLDRKSNLFTCATQMVVQNDQSILEGFDMCRVKENPNESLIIGERENGDVFLISFNGASIGNYEGLIFSTAEGFEENVNSEVEVDIIVYDNVANVLAGTLNGEYVDSNETFKVSFIGIIE